MDDSDEIWLSGLQEFLFNKLIFLLEWLFSKMADLLSHVPFQWMVLMNSSALAFNISCSTQLYFPPEWLSSEVVDLLRPVLTESTTKSIFDSRWLWDLSTLLHLPPLECSISCHVSMTDGWLRSSLLIRIWGFLKHHTSNLLDHFSFGYEDPLTCIMIKWKVQIFFSPYWLQEFFNLVHLLSPRVLNLWTFRSLATFPLQYKFVIYSTLQSFMNFSHSTTGISESTIP